MEIQGTVAISAPRDVVWEMLNDPEFLRQSIPGCQTLDQTPEGGFAATVKLKVGPVSATFRGSVRLENLDPPNGYSIVGQGEGGVAGFAKGGADVKLVDTGAGTDLSYVAHAQVGGKLAQLGSRLIVSTARKLADEFFAAFAGHVTQRHSDTTNANRAAS